MAFKIIQGDCEELLQVDRLSEIKFFKEIDLTFLDPPFNQDKYYANHNDSNLNNCYKIFKFSNCNYEALIYNIL